VAVIQEIFLKDSYQRAAIRLTSILWAVLELAIMFLSIFSDSAVLVEGTNTRVPWQPPATFLNP